VERKGVGGRGGERVSEEACGLWGPQVAEGLEKKKKKREAGDGRGDGIAEGGRSSNLTNEGKFESSKVERAINVREVL